MCFLTASLPLSPSPLDGRQRHWFVCEERTTHGDMNRVRGPPTFRTIFVCYSFETRKTWRGIKYTGREERDVDSISVFNLIFLFVAVDLAHSCSWQYALCTALISPYHSPLPLSLTPNGVTDRRSQVHVSYIVLLTAVYIQEN